MMTKDRMNDYGGIKYGKITLQRYACNVIAMDHKVEMI
jgi:hypothetical protein